MFGEVARAWAGALEERRRVRARCRRRSATATSRAIKAIWDPLVRALDDETFYGFLARSPHFARFSFREIFGQVGFGTGGWDTDFPNSMLEILRVVYTGADDEHRSIVERLARAAERLWAAHGRASALAAAPRSRLHAASRPA